MTKGTTPRSIPPELAAEMTPAVRAFVEVLLARIAELEDRLGMNPQNSSQPPSSRHPHAKLPSRRPKSKRKRGGQPGHAKHERKPIPTSECDTVEACASSTCRGCGANLHGRDLEPLRHQVWEVPVIKPHVTEYQLHRLMCSHCGTTTCAGLPDGVPTGQAGPRLVALVALLMGSYRQSKRGTATFLSTILGQPCSKGWVVKLQNISTAALRPAYDEMVTALPKEPVIRVDETPTKEANRKCWLWTYVADRYTLFAVRGSRKATGVSEMLGEHFSGVVHCDRARMYLSLPRLQWCWAHLKRDFQALIDSVDQQSKRLGHDLMRPTKDLFALWARYRDGTVPWREFRRLMRPIRKKIDGLLLRGACGGNPRFRGMCDELYAHRDHLWRFLTDPRAEPTNNASERALRHPVIWRKLSFGTQSPAGSRFVETILSVVDTCRKQARNVFEFLVAAVEARYAQRKAPSLLHGV